MDEQTASIFDMAQHHLISYELSYHDASNLVERLAERYKEPWRFYHVVAHLGDVTRFLVDNADKLRRPRVTLWAAMYHDAVYVPQAPSGVNEELSAQLAEAELGPYLTGDELTAIGSYVRRTADHNSDDEDTDLAYLLDSDLLILGAPKEEFAAYDMNIWREYKTSVDPETYKRERGRILRGFYDREYIFATAIAREQCEDQAKANLARKLGELATLL